LADVEAFQRIVRDGRRNGASVTKGFAADPDIARYVDDIYAYRQARAGGVLGRAGRSNRTAVAGRELHSRTEGPTGSRAVLRMWYVGVVPKSGHINQLRGGGS